MVMSIQGDDDYTMAMKMQGKIGVKICPLQTSGTLNFDCVRENCEWWIPEAAACAMVVLAKKAL